MRICITRSSRFAYSETFIRDQIAVFSQLATVYPVHSGRYPERDKNNELLYSKGLWAAHKITKAFLGRNNIFSDLGMKSSLKRNKIEVVLSNYGIAAAHMVAPCKDLNIPLLPIFHGHDATDRKLLAQYHEPYQKLFNYAFGLIVVSNEMKSHLVKMGAQASKIHVIPCGVDTAKFTPGHGTKTAKQFIAVGRFTQKKGPMHSIRAFHKVIQKEPEAKLIMVGAHSGLYQDCENLVKELGMENSIVFTGVLKPAEIIGLMRSSIGFIQHSMITPNGDMEGTPVSIMEASACGLPIISTLHGGIKDAVIHGETGFLVEEKDEGQMAHYILEVCKNPEMAREMGKNGRRHIQKNYEQKIQVGKLYDLAQQSIA